MTFPGKVTEADGGTVEGTKVSFKDNDKHEVKGKDKPANERQRPAARRTVPERMTAVPFPCGSGS